MPYPRRLSADSSRCTYNNTDPKTVVERLRPPNPMSTLQIYGSYAMTSEEQELLEQYLTYHRRPGPAPPLRGQQRLRQHPGHVRIRLAILPGLDPSPGQPLPTSITPSRRRPGPPGRGAGPLSGHHPTNKERTRANERDEAGFPSLNMSEEPARWNVSKCSENGRF